MFVERPPGTGGCLPASNGAPSGVQVLDSSPPPTPGLRAARGEGLGSGSLLRKEAGRCPGEITGPPPSRKSRLATGRDTEVLRDSGSRHLNVRTSSPFQNISEIRSAGEGGEGGKDPEGFSNESRVGLSLSFQSRDATNCTATFRVILV